MLMRASTLQASILLLLIGGTSGFSLLRQANCQTADTVAQAAGIELNEQNYAAWRDHILPKESELDWQQIPWLTTFKDGILAANADEKPLLFWTMNGHPLGCT